MRTTMATSALTMTAALAGLAAIAGACPQKDKKTSGHQSEAESKEVVVVRGPSRARAIRAVPAADRHECECPKCRMKPHDDKDRHVRVLRSDHLSVRGPARWQVRRDHHDNVDHDASREVRTKRDVIVEFDHRGPRKPHHQMRRPHPQHDARRPHLRKPMHRLGPPHGPKPPHPPRDARRPSPQKHGKARQRDMRQRLQHVRQAVRHLHQAGLHEVAERVTKHVQQRVRKHRAEKMDKPHRGKNDNRKKRKDDGARTELDPKKLHQQVQELRKAVKYLKEEVKDMHKRGRGRQNQRPNL